MPFGAFVEFMPGKDGLLHISEIKWERLETMEGVLEVGEEIKVKLVEVDKKTGKFRLSRKVLIPETPEKGNYAVRIIVIAPIDRNYTLNTILLSKRTHKNE
jgi:predicted RNA-binding protein with RPS1 domain